MGWQAAEDAGLWACGDDDDDDKEGSGSSSSGSDSLEVKPDSSKKLRVFLAADAASPISLTELEDRKGETERLTAYAS